MKKNFLAALALIVLMVSMTSCFKKKYNFDAMIDEYIMYQEQGDTENAEKMYNKLMELEDQMTDDQFYRLEEAK